MTSAWWQLDWVWQTAGWTLAAAGLVWLFWALFWDRARGRKRCPGCWYDLSGTKSLDCVGGALSDGVLCVCPECGRRVTRVRQILKTRRRWRLAFLSFVVLAIGLGIPSWLAIKSGRGLAYAPTTALVLLVSPEDMTYNTEHDPIAVEIVRRMEVRMFPAWQSQILIGCILDAGLADADGLIRTRERAPIDAELNVSGDPSLRCFFQMPWGEHVRLHVRLLSTPDGRPGPWIVSDGAYLMDARPAGFPAPGEEARWEVMLRTSEQLLWHGTRTTKTRVAGTAAEVLLPVSSPEMNNQIVNGTKVTLELRRDHIRATFRPKVPKLDNTIAFGAELILRRDGETIATGQIVRDRSDQLLARRSAIDWGMVWLSRVRAAPPIESIDERWTLEIRGTRDLALRDYDQFGWASPSQKWQQWKEPTTFWSGTVTVPVSVATEQDE